MNKNTQRYYNTSLTVMLLVIGIIILSLFGWVANLIQLIALLDGPITAMLLLKIAGVFAAPLGAILGFVGL